MDVKLYVQWSHGDIPLEYFTNGKYPNGTEPEWVWEDRYIPLPHYVNNTKVSGHVFRREKVGDTGFWSLPIKIGLSETNELSKKLDKNDPIPANTKTKITYDSNGLVIKGEDISISDIPGLQDILYGNNALLTNINIIVEDVLTNINVTISPTELQYIQSNIYSTVSISNPIQLQAKPITGNRIDVIYISDTGQLLVKTGNVNIIPDKPALIGNEIEVRSFYISATEVIVSPLVNLQNVIYIGQHGNDNNDGRSITNAVKTLSKGCILMLSTGITSIIILDGGTYYLNTLFPFGQYSIFAPNATILLQANTVAPDIYIIQTNLDISCRLLYYTAKKILLDANGAGEPLNCNLHTPIIQGNVEVNGEATLNLKDCWFLYGTPKTTSVESTIIFDSCIVSNFDIQLQYGTVKGVINDKLYPEIVATESIKGIAQLSNQTDAEIAITESIVGNINHTKIITPRALRWAWNKIVETVAFGHNIYKNTIAFTTRKKLTFLDGNNSTITVADDQTNDQTTVKVDVDLSNFELLANKATNLTSPNNTKYPTTLAISTIINGINARLDTITPTNFIEQPPVIVFSDDLIAKVTNTVEWYEGTTYKSTQWPYEIELSQRPTGNLKRFVIFYIMLGNTSQNIEIFARDSFNQEIPEIPILYPGEFLLGTYLITATGENTTTPPTNVIPQSQVTNLVSDLTTLKNATQRYLIKRQNLLIIHLLKIAFLKKYISKRNLGIL